MSMIHNFPGFATRNNTILRLAVREETERGWRTERKARARSSGGKNRSKEIEGAKYVSPATVTQLAHTYVCIYISLARNSNRESSKFSNRRTFFRKCRFANFRFGFVAANPRLSFSSREFREAQRKSEKKAKKRVKKKKREQPRDFHVYAATHRKQGCYDFPVRNRTGQVIRVEIYVRDASRANYPRRHYHGARRFNDSLALFPPQPRAKLASLIPILLSRGDKQRKRERVDETGRGGGSRAGNIRRTGRGRS